MPLDQSVIRITKELSTLQAAPDLSLTVACRDTDVRNVRALVMGPHETPYEFGFFEFSVHFSADYPSNPPSVVCVTTDRGKCRFNPNIYASGKVCLSILGTWRGERGEQWSSAQGLESILLSIQSLMSNNPYENEPGFENARTLSDKAAQAKYREKIKHETLRVSIIQRLEGYLGMAPAPGTKPAASQEELIDEEDEESGMSSEPFEPFKDLCKARFLWYYDSYVAMVAMGKSEAKDGTDFKRMPFESSGHNAMDGKFQYARLETRLKAVKAALESEVRTWEKDGIKDMEAEGTVSVNLQHQHEQVVNRLKYGNLPHDVTMENGNPFVWIMTYFGQPSTNLDGGLFRIRVNFSPRFPAEQPRVKVVTSLFHHLITADGTLCCSPNPDKRDSAWAHIEAIISCLGDDDPVYDPRKIVNLEAARLLWNQGPEGKKLYARRLRRAAQQSIEDLPE